MKSTHKDLLKVALVLIGIAAITLLYGKISQAFAADAVPACAPVNMVDNLLAAGKGPDGFTVADDLPVKGALFDREIVVIYQGSVFLWFAKEGCIVAQPLFMGPMPTDAAAPPVTPQSAPVLHGGGAEIGT